MSKPIASLLHWAKRLTPSDQQFALYALSHMMDRNLSFCSYTPQAVLPRTTSKQAEQNHDLKCHTSCSDQTRFVHKAKLTLLLSHARAWSWARRVKSPDRVSFSPADDARKLATPNPSRKSNWRESTETCFVHQKRRWKQLTLKTSLTDSDETSEELQTWKKVRSTAAILAISLPSIGVANSDENALRDVFAAFTAAYPSLHVIE